MRMVGAVSSRILIVDDEPQVLEMIAAVLRSGGYAELKMCNDAREVRKLLAFEEFDLLLLDLNMPNLSGKQILSLVREEHPDIPVIIISGLAEVALAVECMKQGVFDYLVKPVERSKLLATVCRALEIRELQRENTSLKRHLLMRQLQNPEAFRDIIFQDEKMLSLLLYIESIANSSQTVLITGETGTGKELVAKAIHQVSGRKGHLVCINVAGNDENLFADTLFGHLKGAFTGADHNRPGLIEQAEGGTLFLDEIGDLRPDSQVKLLRLLESREYYQLGSDTLHRSTARILVATNRDLEAAVDDGSFRKDLYYRLRTYHVHIPPLRERTTDIPLLVDHFVQQASEELGKVPPSVKPELIAILRRYPFPGNVRELRSMVFDAVSRHHSGPLSPESFLEFKGLSASHRRHPPDDCYASSIELPTIKEATDMLVQEAMKRAGGKQSIAARILGISPQALNHRLKRFKNKVSSRHCKLTADS